MKVIIDTNVIYLSREPIDDLPDDMVRCAEKCNRYLTEFLNNPNPKIVLDSTMAIYNEYKKAYESVKQTSQNVATRFCQWLFYYIRNIDPQDFIDLPLDKRGQYVDFPKDKRLETFDLMDRKFVALANKHPERPFIIEGSDCKWWGFREVFKDLGINVFFVDEEYVKTKYQQKIGKI